MGCLERGHVGGIFSFFCAVGMDLFLEHPISIP